MTSLFATPDPDLEDQQVIGEIHETRASLADYLRAPKRWNGLLRRTSTARAIQGSNTIEGYTVSDEDAVAAVDDEPPLSADEETWLEIIAYRRVLTYVLNVATEPGFVIDEAVLRSMHFMLLDHDLSDRPCQDNRIEGRGPVHGSPSSPSLTVIAASSERRVQTPARPSEYSRRQPSFASSQAANA